MRDYFARFRSDYAIALLSCVAFLVLLPASSNAQSTTKQAGSGAKAAAAGSTNKATKVSLEGYCPVCIIDMKKWVKGNAAITSTFDGQTYLFPGQEQKAAFDANPAKYVPALGGDCTVAYKKMNQRVPGNIRQAAFANSRLYLFSNEMAKKEFEANNEPYVNVDLALGGKCTVCKIEMQKDVAGKPEFATIYQGMRYYFPSADQQAMFNANPAKYAVSKHSSQQAGNTTSGSAAKGSAAKGSAAKGSDKK